VDDDCVVDDGAVVAGGVDDEAGGVDAAQAWPAAVAKSLIAAPTRSWDSFDIRSARSCGGRPVVIANTARWM